MKKKDLDFIKEQKHREETWHKSIEDCLEDIAERAWMVGIRIRAVEIEDGWIQNFVGYSSGVRITLRKPKVKVYETSFGSIKNESCSSKSV